jgi:DTW domain-containing protein YfiP
LTLAVRDVCYTCHKPRTTCVCGHVRRVDNRTAVLVLQHPRERAHPIGTARFLELGLARAEVRVAWNAGEREDTPPPWLPEDAALLYPSPDAVDLRDLPAAARPGTLLALDGTWHTARTLYRDKRWLARLPHVRLSPQAPSRYRIRREPSAHCVSTLEAIVLALSMLEPETEGLEALLEAFDGMIDQQLGFIARGEGMLRTKARRPREWRKTPRALVEDFGRLVVVYAESARPDPRAERELVQCVGVELATGRHFERLVRPSFGLPSATHLEHMQLTEEDFEGAIEPRALTRLFSEFLGGCAGPSPILAAWNQGTLDLVTGATGLPVSRAALKNAYRTVHGRGGGSLEDSVASEGLAVAPAPCRGRAALRLALARAMAEHLHDVAVRPRVLPGT